MVKIVFKKHAVMGDVIAVQRVVAEADLEQQFDNAGRYFVVKISAQGIDAGLSKQIRHMKGVSKITIT